MRHTPSAGRGTFTFALAAAAMLVLPACNGQEGDPEDAPAAPDAEEEAPAEDDPVEEPNAEDPDDPRGELSSVPDDAEAEENEELAEEDGGTFLVRCSEGQAELVWWVPDEDFTVDDVDEGPEADVDIEFESDTESFDYEVTCVDDTPEVEVDHDT